jgi:hypothetical protein
MSSLTWLPVAREAAATYRDLAGARQASPTAPGPARSLSNLAAILTNPGRADEAEKILKGSGN